MGTDATGDMLSSQPSWASPVVLRPPAAGQPPGDGLGLAAQPGVSGGCLQPEASLWSGDAPAPQLALMNILRVP